jgi:hypothetical protein
LPACIYVTISHGTPPPKLRPCYECRPSRAMILGQRVAACDN